MAPALHANRYFCQSFSGKIGKAQRDEKIARAR
jgi:hypothetical protein